MQFPTKKSIKHFIGTIVDISEIEDNYTIKFLKKVGKGFTYPEKEDISDLTFFDIVRRLEPYYRQKGLLLYFKR